MKGFIMRSSIVQIIDGVRYDTDKAQVVASNEYWDGHNYERQGRNTHLYKTKKGNFFAGYSTLWQGEKDYLEPLSKEEAKELYESLREQDLTYEEAFGETPQEA